MVNNYNKSLNLINITLIIFIIINGYNDILLFEILLKIFEAILTIIQAYIFLPLPLYIIAKLYIKLKNIYENN